MIKFDLLLKRMWTVLAVLFCTVVSAQAAAITYQLTTHVDGRTITATANLNAGDNLNDKMPQTLWRAYTTYKYYSDAALTQEITEAPAGGTVYVDYEFDPPFYLSEEGQEPIYHYLRSYNAAGSNNYLVIYDQSAEDEWGTYKKTILSWRSVNGATPKAGRNYPIAKAGHDQWAFYGDGYAFQIRLNDSSIANNYLIWRSTSRAETPMGLGAKPEVGWQLYVNTAENSKMTGTMAMGPYNATNYLASLENVNYELWTDGLTTSEQYFDEHNQLVSAKTGHNIDSSYKNALWWYAFFATPTTDPANSNDIWHVTYKIQKADGTWYDDIVVQKRANNLTPTWPVAGFEPVEGYEYDYFYTDATFTEKFQGAMPNDCNTTLYIKETAPVEPVIYYVTYKIQQADGTWYEDIVKEKDPNNLTPAFPTEYTQKEGYTYDYFYKDATFEEKLEEGYTMPADENTVLFIKETAPVYTVTYKILQADGNWYEDIVKEKDPNNLTPAFPAEYTQKEGYTYDYFYKDENFTEKCAEDYTMPADENTILFIKETAPVYTVTYKILQADGNWYEDIVKEKDPNNLTPAFPSEEYSMKDGCEYDYFYQDETFQEKFEGDMPANENTVLYIKEKVIEYVSEPWKTLVIPFGIENLASFFGEDFEGVPAVDVLEFQNIEDGVITRVGDEDFYRCKLIFNPVYFIEAYKPYLIRLNRAYKSARDEMYAAEKGERDCEVTIVNDPANAGISVYMEGTLEDNGYPMDASDGLHFYFGYDANADAYNFYRVSATIPKNRCWFEVVDQRPAGAKLNVTFDMDAITGIGQVVSAKAADGRIYNINGQQVQGTLQKGIYIVNGKKVNI